METCSEDEDCGISLALRDCIKTHLDYLCKKTTNLQMFLVELHSKGIITEYEKDDIIGSDNTKNKYHRCHQLYYEIIWKRSDSINWEVLKDALITTENNHIVKKIDPSYQKEDTVIPCLPDEPGISQNPNNVELTKQDVDSSKKRLLLNKILVTLAVCLLSVIFVLSVMYTKQDKDSSLGSEIEMNLLLQQMTPEPSEVITEYSNKKENTQQTEAESTTTIKYNVSTGINFPKHNETPFDFKNGATRGNSKSTCKIQESDDYENKAEVVFLDCGGLIDIPSEGKSILLNYNFNKSYPLDKHCLWTLGNTHNKIRFGFKVNATLECEGFGQDKHILTLIEFSTAKDYALSSYRLTTESVYSTSGFVDGIFLSFASPGVYDGSGFLLRLDIIATHNVTNNGSNNELGMSSDKGKYGPLKREELVSVIVDPPKESGIVKARFLESRNINNQSPCNDRDSLDLYSLDTRGETRKILRYCENSTTPISVNTTYPLIILHHAYQSTTGFQITCT